MTFTAEQSARVLEAVNEKIKPPIACPTCHTTNWTLARGFVFMVLQDTLAKVNLAGPTIPAVALICDQCGNVQLLSALKLGLTDLLGPPADVASP